MDVIRASVEEDYKRVNNDTWICNQLEDLVVEYEKRLYLDNGRDLSDIEQGEHNMLYSILHDLKELLYKAD